MIKQRCFVTLSDSQQTILLDCGTQESGFSVKRNIRYFPPPLRKILVQLLLNQMNVLTFQKCRLFSETMLCVHVCFLLKSCSPSSFFQHLTPPSKHPLHTNTTNALRAEAIADIYFNTRV